MVKVKNKAKKKGLSDKINKKEKTQKVLNPFEVRVNRSKFQVLGRKSKNDWGLPGIARAKSIKKRKETLLQEFKVKDKANRFIDRRIGEKNAAMTSEDRIMARFAAEKMRHHSKKAIFNLADNEELTHRGQTLSEIEKFDDPRSDDDEDDEDKFRSGKLDGKFVEEAHFGGGIFTKGEEGTKSRAALIDELIAESKKRKAERQLAKEETLQLTEKLDTEWKDLLPLVNANSKEEEIPEKRTKESYDMLMRELKFESRGVPSDRLKSEEEIAKEEKERLEKLEEERIKRMKGFDKTESKTVVHRSADDLDDGFDITSDIEEDESNKSKKTTIRREEGSGASSDDSEDGEEEEEDDDDNNDNGGGVGEEEEEAEREVTEEDVNKNDDEPEATTEKDKHDETDDEEADSAGEEEFDYDLSDLRGAASEESDVEDNKTPEKRDNMQKVKVASKNGVKQSVGKDEMCTESESSKMDTEKFKQELMKRKKQMEEARKELPYTFQVPETFEEFQKLMSGRNVEEQAVIIERMIKCNHPSLGDKNREKLSNVFAFLLQHLNDTDGHECWTVLDRLSPFLFDLTQFSPNEAAHCVCEVLKEKHSDFKQKPQKYPASDTLVFLQLIALLFPTSDTRHQVTTPATVFLCQMLNQCKIKSATDIASGLLVTTILLEYISLSKRFCVEAVNFLRGCMCMAIPGETDVETLPPFKPTQRLLVLAQSQENLDISGGALQLKFSYLSKEDQATLDDSFRLSALYTALQLVCCFAQTYESLPASSVVFKPLLKALKCVQVNRYPKVVRDKIESVQSQLTALTKKKLSYVVLERKRPKALKLYEPDIQPVYDRKTFKSASEEKQEHDKLVHKYKKEMKGALREIRRDRSFLAKIKFKNQAKTDEERIKKVKQIYSWGANQQSEVRKLKRKK